MPCSSPNSSSISLRARTSTVGWAPRLYLATENWITPTPSSLPIVGGLPAGRSSVMSTHPDGRINVRPHRCTLSLIEVVLFAGRTEAYAFFLPTDWLGLGQMFAHLR